VPRALTLNRTIVPLPDRDRFFTRARALRTHFESHGCHYWVFEDAALAGAFIEFAEGQDVDALTNAYSSAPESGVDPERIYREVAL
jgi:hypothetical protein